MPMMTQETEYKRNTSIIYGTEFQYQIDTSYGLEQGFIAEGTESIVYKGIKSGGNLRCSCALKFKPKHRLHDFMNREYKILESMQTCRSVVRVLDVIEDLGDFRIDYIIDDNHKIHINRDNTFCVVEEYIDGESLQDYCIHQWYEYDTNKRIWKRNSVPYEYRKIVEFQNQIVQFMINLCEIMKFVSNLNSENQKIDPNMPIVLHCDIKPENIMVTKHGKELVLIDFGRSCQIREGNTFQHYNNPEEKTFIADYSSKWDDKGKNNFYAYGTIGYAAPECFADAALTDTFPFSSQCSGIQNGLISIESDIFGFGATFYECFSIFEICKKAFDKTPDSSNPRFFNDFITQQAKSAVQEGRTDKYCDRDFEELSLAYHERLEDIIRKCTHRRTKDFQNIRNSDSSYYHNFYELQSDIEGARNIIPPLDRKTDPIVNQMISFSGFFLDLGTVFLSLVVIMILCSDFLAKSHWNMLTAGYTSNQKNTLKTIANEMTGTIYPYANYKNFETILDFMYNGKTNDSVIDEYEAGILISLLRNNLSDTSRWGKYSDEIMQHCNTDELDGISEEIYMNLSSDNESSGYQLAKSIYQAKNTNDTAELCQAYDTLKTYASDKAYQEVTYSLAFKLMTSSKVDKIAEGKELTREEVQKTLTEIMNAKGE